jgi:hypothetical protein
MVACPRGRTPADGPAFNTIIPTWREGDEFLAGELLQRFQILGVSPVDEDDDVREAFDGFWLVEPVG